MIFIMNTQIDITKLDGIKIITDYDYGFYIKGSGYRIPKINIDRNLALFLGLMWGDGCIVSRKCAIKTGDWRICFVEDDKDLIDTFCNITRLIFNIRPHVHFRKTYYEVIFSNRIVYEILYQFFKFPDGHKINRLKIPFQIKTSKNLISSFLQGLFSTDGKFVIDRGYPRVGFDSATKLFLDDVVSILIDSGFNPRKTLWNRKNGNVL